VAWKHEERGMRKEIREEDIRNTIFEGGAQLLISLAWKVPSQCPLVLLV
jgi:hypothetical protein